MMDASDAIAKRKRRALAALTLVGVLGIWAVLHPPTPRTEAPRANGAPSPALEAAQPEPVIEQVAPAVTPADVAVSEPLASRPARPGAPVDHGRDEGHGSERWTMSDAPGELDFEPRMDEHAIEQNAPRVLPANAPMH